MWFTKKSDSSVKKDNKNEKKRQILEKKEPIHVKKEREILKNIYKIEEKIHEIQEQLISAEDERKKAELLGKKVRIEDNLGIKLKNLKEELVISLHEVNKLLHLINQEESRDYNSFKDLMEKLKLEEESFELDSE